jgi:threonylcarbamoyladenosine tRNA methylthiotransferase MtaB
MTRAPSAVSEEYLIKAIAFHSIGCRTNQEEMTALAFRLAGQGCAIVDRADEAEVVVVNTCSVTSGTEAKTRRFLRQLSRSAPRAGICVTGCLAQQQAEQLRLLPNVRWVVGNGLKKDIPSIISENPEGIFWGPLEPKRSSLELLDAPIFFNGSRRTRFSVKIQEGCDFRCSYCIVPLVQGGSRSAPLTGILEVCRKAIESGFKEIVLSGTHIGQYNDNGQGLEDLLETITLSPGDYRVRLSSLDPRDLTNKLIGLIGAHGRLCNHLHVSVQSLSQKILEKMDRSALSADSIVERLVKARTAFPQMGIGGDFIVGFPGETTEQFEETVRNVKKIGFSYGHVFRYSRRPSTSAADFPGQIDEKEKIRRSALLRSVLDECRDEFVRRCIGSAQRILVETENPVSGFASNYLRLEAPGAACKRNDWCAAVVAENDAATGRCRAVASRSSQ